jgi:hypothetical protein
MYMCTEIALQLPGMTWEDVLQVDGYMTHLTSYFDRGATDSLMVIWRGAAAMPKLFLYNNMPIYCIYATY